MNKPGRYHIGRAFFVKEKIGPAKTIALTLSRTVIQGQNPVDRSLLISVNLLSSSIW
jgi:hypothetical protein